MLSKGSRESSQISHCPYLAVIRSPVILWVSELSYKYLVKMVKSETVERSNIEVHALIRCMLLNSKEENVRVEKDKRI